MTIDHHQSTFLHWLSPQAKGWAASLLMHGVAFGALAAVTARSIEHRHMQFGAERLETTIVMPPAVESEAAAVANIQVEVSPASARIAQQRYRLTKSAERMVEPTYQSDLSLSRAEAIIDLPQVAEDPSQSAQRTLSRIFSGPPPMPKVEPIEIGATTLPEFGNNLPPVYPQSAIDRRQEGTALLRVTISDGGRVTKVELVESSGFAVLDAAAVSAVKTWRAKPATQAGQSIPTVIRLPIRFKLPKPRN